MLDRLADADVLELLVLGVHAQPHVLQRPGDGGGAARGRGLLVARQRLRGDQPDIDLVRLEGELGRLVVVDQDVADLLEGGLGTLPLRIGREHHLLLGGPVHEVRAASGWNVDGKLAADLLHGLRAEDEPAAAGQPGHHERREGLLEMDRAAVGAGDLDPVHDRPIAAPVRRRQALQGVFHVLRGDLAEAVGPGKAGLEREIDAEAVLMHRDRLRDLRWLPADLVALDLVGGQPRHDSAQDIDLHAAGHVAGIEHRDVGGGAHPNDPGLRRPHRAGERGHTERRARQGRLTQDLAPRAKHLSSPWLVAAAPVR